MMARLQYDVIVDWNGDGVLSSSNDENVTSRTIALEFERGRSFPSQLTGRAKSGEAVVTLDNRSGDYSPFNGNSPLFGDLLPGRKVRIRWGEAASSFTTAWTGFIETLNPEAVLRGANTATIRAIGELGRINADKIQVNAQQNITGDSAIGLVLDAAGNGSSDRVIDDGLTTMTRWWADDIEPLTALRQLERVEAGFINESREGKVLFENRNHRLQAPHTIIQSTWSDASDAKITYRKITEEDPLPQIFNVFDVDIRRYANGASSQTLWQMSSNETPDIESSETEDFWASYPGLDAPSSASFVDTWTTPVANTHWTANTQSDGSGDDVSTQITASITEFSNALKMSLTNESTATAFITSLKATGTPVFEDNPLQVRREDTESQDKFGVRRFPDPPKFAPDHTYGVNWALYNLGIYKDPIPIMRVELDADRSSAVRNEILTRDISDRIKLVATNNAGLGVSKEFFVEAEHHIIDRHRVHIARYDLSPVEGFAGFWVLDISLLDIATLFNF